MANNHKPGNNKKNDANGQKRAELEDAKRRLEEAGFLVKPRRALVKHTFEVDPKLLRRFRDCQESLGLKLKDALAEALEMWLAAKDPTPSKK